MKYLMILLLSLLTMISCKKDETDSTYETVFTVSPTIEYVAPGPPANPDSPKNIPAMRIFDKNSQETFTLTLGQIEGFIFEEGNSYVLNIEVIELADPPADGHAKKYKLLKIISKN